MFSWSNNSSSKPSRRTSGAATRGRSREEHLRSYLEHPTLKPSTRKVSNDDTTYDTVFQTKNANALIIRVHFPSAQQRPKMTLVGVNASHNWIDSKMRVTGYPPIQSDSAWSVANMPLGDAINNVVQHFQLHPPEVFEITDPNLIKIQERISGTSANGFHSSQAGGTPAPPPPVVESELPPHFNEVLKVDGSVMATQEAMLSNVQMPPIPTTFPEFDTMTRSELKVVLNDDDRLLSTIEQTHFVTEIEASKESVGQESVKAAQVNLEMEDTLKEVYDEVQQMQKDMEEKVEKFNKLQKKQTDLCQPEDKKKVIKKLQMAKKEAYKESEEIASNWMDGDLELKDFVNSFLEKRTVHHVRAAKIERLENS
jgi:ESCRT-I complex subunit VPS37